MIISHSHRFVILAPWKTASQTIRARLDSYCESPYGSFFYFNEHLNRVVHQHITFADFSALPESRLDYRVAAFVRNPYDRVYSGFRQLQKDLEIHPGAPFPSPWVRRLVMAQLTENAAGLLRAGLDFDTWLAELDEALILDTGRNTSFPLHPAHYWTHASGRQAVGFVGRVERFEEDFDHLCRWLEIDAERAVNANVAASDAELAGGDYRYSARMSPSSIRRIEELFAADFDLFGYERLSPRARNAPPSRGTRSEPKQEKRAPTEVKSRVDPELEQARHELDVARAALIEREAALAAVRASMTWRLTAPMRSLRHGQPRQALREARGLLAGRRRPAAH